MRIYSGFGENSLPIKNLDAQIAKMLRYDLDKLGWFEFEHLCQTLLKHKLGLGIEAWGGTKDWGRDAYYPEALKYPTEETQNGPFLFQCKFVNGANSAGAEIEKPVLNAIRQECDAIERRLSAQKWKILPKVYTFLTNAILAGPIREQIEKNLKDILSDSIITLQDGNDICALIDLTTGIARRFPQILSLNDLDVLLSDCVNKDILNRSEAAVEEAKEISKIFVPTEAYSKAINVLQEFHYVVLEGPPEVGKTAIGRMIALSYIPEGWEVIECRLPNDFLRKYNHDQKQIFVADDSFGRTEYNPERVSHWQDDLPSILRKINNHHLLIMTSRKHLLEMAREKLDVPGANQDFPLPAEVLIDVSSLTTVDKTLMLYKHMKHASLTKAQKMFVRGLAKKIVEHTGFTPERIRELSLKTKTNGCTSELIEETLTNPTGRMSKTYRELPVAYKWFMIAVLLNYSDDPGKIKNSYEILCPSEEMIKFEKIVAQLSEAFIKTITSLNPKERGPFVSISWIHPSCGDMVATELSDNPRDRIHFLTHCDISGLKYAVSVGGGSEGSKALPLLKSPKDWAIFKSRCNKGWTASLLNNISDSIQHLTKNTKYHEERELLKDVLKEVIINVVEQVNRKGCSGKELLAILKIIKLYPDTKRPKIEYKNPWLEHADSAIELLEADYLKWHRYADSDLETFISLTKSIMNYDSHCFDNDEIRNKWQSFTETLLSRGEDESSNIHDDDPALAEDLYSNYDSTKRLFEEASTMMESEEENKQCLRIRDNFVALMEDISEYLPGEPDYERDDDFSSPNPDECSIEGIFKDL
ncbi:MAG: hypothetical protein MUP16_09730 [Sedimentisphaerales bacterium]|nr:hypothetical protein [Sedimentisphaerales bacterium]